MAKIPSRASVVVAIPVRDEAQRIAACLRALAFQSAPSPYQIVLLLNNCEDETASIVKELAPSLPVPVHRLEIKLTPNLANAGYARRLAMEAAAEIAEPGGVLLTTDADGCVYPDWIALNLQELRQGAEAVAGRIEIDPVEATLIPTKLHEDDARECVYAALLDEITTEIDPDPFDPMPRHSEHSGASIAVTVPAYRRAGGIPALALGEDRAFFTALRRVDARIRHALKVRVIVSGRTVGRAIGGMADTIRRRMVSPDKTLDDRLEPAIDAVRRASMRKVLRLAWSNPEQRYSRAQILSELLLMRSTEIASLFSKLYFGTAWADLELRSPLLRRRTVSVAELEHETELARSILNECRQHRVSSPVPTGPTYIQAADEPVGD